MLTLETLCTAQHLRQAWEAVQRRNAAPGVDGQSTSDYATQLEQNLQALYDSICSGAYRPRPTQRIWLVKPRGGERGVINLCVQDRIVQGAILRSLSAHINPVLSRASFAYRQGMGSVQAAHRLLEHHRAGRKWVLCSDITEFFDRIKHPLLCQALTHFLDPSAVTLILSILRAPVRDGHSIHIPEIGIAQGSPLSPLLSNLYVTPFDHALNSPDRALVRYADDFVVACHSAKAAGESLEIATATLEQLGLSLSGSKTQIINFDQGFDYLGFQFSNTVRVAPHRVHEFKAHLESLLTRGDARGVREANDLIRGWRNYYTLGHVQEDFKILDQWLEDRFERKAKLLERLTPKLRHAPAPRLGEYERPRNQPGRTSAPSRNSSNPYSNVTRDQHGRPVTVTNGQTTSSLHNLAVLLVTPVLLEIIDTLELSALLHRAYHACTWKTAPAADAISLLASAITERSDALSALTRYEQALYAHTTDDPRDAHGKLRHALRHHVWSALLQSQITLGPEANKRYPRLVEALSEAFESYTADRALLQAIKLGQLNAPLPALERTLTSKHPHPEHPQPINWISALIFEAQKIKRSLEQGEPYRPWRITP